MSGKTMIFLPLRELRRSDVSPDLPPVASHRYWGIIAEHMMAVFSDSTRATVLLGCWGKEGFRVAFLLCPSATLSLKMSFFEDKRQ